MDPPALFVAICAIFHIVFFSLAIPTEVRLEEAAFLDAHVLLPSSSDVHVKTDEVRGIENHRADWNVEEFRFEVNEKELDDEPLQLIRPTEGHDRLELNELVVEKLAAITDPVAFVAVVGPYHSGKSFLLNVLLNSSHGFLVGSTPEPETKGIWMRILPKGSETSLDGCRVILLDTEGFYGEGASRSYDARIFAVATLLSSHLVYNTLRTLGDAQSVSALADLSKQAQVFNLQNWLHSAEDDSDKKTSAWDVNPFLLLKTLNFPPLTWVVQGFDLDVQHAYSPMDYLQKYLVALAHTGDRTLDMLFTQGIRCYTLRTPADLNALRFQYGGQGLAADEELYNDLHPSYLSDLEQVRQGVFGNLTAKGEGKLTGKNLARLIPLLVHYLNEDFPLHADRKLRDVVMDIVVDGAFSGGVQYFQLCMRPISKGAVLPSGNSGSTLGHIDTFNKAETSNAQGKFSGFLASALTSEQLELFIASAETKAIEYCRRRCVGVPQGLVAPTCEGQLGVKLARMKPFYREVNERHVKEVLLLLGEGLRNAAEKAIASLQLPMREGDLQNHCTQAIKDALKGYEALVGLHRSSHLYHEAKVQMEEFIQQKCDKILRINVDQISVILNNAKGAYRTTYEESMKATGLVSPYIHNGREIDSNEESLISQGAKPISPKKLAELNSASVLAAQAAFEKEVKAGGLAWVGPGYELYDFHQFQCLQWSKQQFTGIQAQNEARVKSFHQQLASSLAHRYKEEVMHVTPFPDNDETITDKANALGKQLIDEYNTIVKEFSTSTSDDKRRELSSNIEEARVYLLKKNTALMAAFCYDPLMEAYKELHMQDCERTLHNILVSRSFWSFKCLWPGPSYLYGFKYAAHSAARKYLDRAVSGTSSTSTVSNHDVAKGVVLSPTTRNKVIQAWIEHDLAHHANLVLTNCSIVVACIVPIVTTICFMSRSKQSNPGISSQSRRYMNAKRSYDTVPTYSHFK